MTAVVSPSAASGENHNLASAPATLGGAGWLRSSRLLALAVTAVYGASLGAGWLDYDDTWLVRDNELLGHRALDVGRVLFGFDRETRLILGAEYLPVRDLVVWFGRGLLGLDAAGLRVMQLAGYLGASALLLEWAKTIGPVLSAQAQRGLFVAVWLFALHPVHAESVAWLAGTKDVLCLFFTAAALFLHARRDARSRWLALGCVALGCLSKGAAVMTPALLVLSDLWAGRRLEPRTLVPSLVMAACFAALHAWVGGIVGMFAEPLSDDALVSALTMATVLARYLGLSFLFLPGSLFYDVAAVPFDARAIGSIVLLAGLAGLALALLRRGVRWPLVALLFFLVPLIPVSQLLAPLQNRMADRYLLVAVLGPTIAMGQLLEGGISLLRPSLAHGVRAGVLSVVGALALLRALVFSDPVVLFQEATEETLTNAGAPYALAQALVARGDLPAAERAYRTAMERDGLHTDRGRRAGNNLGRLLVRDGRDAEALALYQTLVDRYPDDPRVLHNLADVEEHVGDAAGAATHRARLAARFPTYDPHAAERPGPL